MLLRECIQPRLRRVCARVLRDVACVFPVTRIELNAEDCCTPRRPLFTVFERVSPCFRARVFVT
jgi:hypothetical protein